MEEAFHNGEGGVLAKDPSSDSIAETAIPVLTPVLTNDGLASKLGDWVAEESKVLS
jgi:hypothetical protein